MVGTGSLGSMAPVCNVCIYALGSIAPVGDFTIIFIIKHPMHTFHMVRLNPAHDERSWLG